MKLFEVQNKSPKWLLVEDKNGKDFHIEHLEDLIFSGGFNGARSAFNYIENLRRMFAQGQGKIGKVKERWDRGINIICGIDPEDGKFFVGTEVALQQKEAACKSKAEIYKFYGYDDVEAADDESFIVSKDLDIHEAQLEWIDKVFEDFYNVQRYLQTVIDEQEQ
jgi:hypothetical protein